jgi:hypothetical protein
VKFLLICRLEQDGTAKEALLLTEKQAHETTLETLTEAQERNEELLKKIHEDDKTILQLKFTIQRSITVSWLLIPIYQLMLGLGLVKALARRSFHNFFRPFCNTKSKINKFQFNPNPTRPSL